ncbi:MAG: hypothetical protein EB125_02875, partial [Betaproteobacteria bacterium]|nr:hypothetical protein [Betaproteobacteria bacterium]
LPYNISSPILFHLLESAEQIIDQHLMLQKEVVDRLVAGHGSKFHRARRWALRCHRRPRFSFRCWESAHQWWR